VTLALGDDSERLQGVRKLAGQPELTADRHALLHESAGGWIVTQALSEEGGIMKRHFTQPGRKAILPLDTPARPFERFGVEAAPVPEPRQRRRESGGGFRAALHRQAPLQGSAQV